MSEDPLSRAIRMQAYVLLIQSPLPPSVRKKMLFALMNEAEIKLSGEELGEIEEMFKPASVQSLAVVAAPPPIHICPKCKGVSYHAEFKYCPFDGTKLKTTKKK